MLNLIAFKSVNKADIKTCIGNKGIDNFSIDIMNIVRFHRIWRTLYLEKLKTIENRKTNSNHSFLFYSIIK